MKRKWISTMSFALAVGAGSFFGMAFSAEHSEAQSAAHWRSVLESSNSEIGPRDRHIVASSGGGTGLRVSDQDRANFGYREGQSSAGTTGTRSESSSYQPSQSVLDGNERAALCNKPGVSCDDEGNTTYTNQDGSRLTVGTDGKSEVLGADGEKYDCMGSAETAETVCRTPGTSGMNPGEAAMFTMMMNQMVTMGTQIATAGKNMAQQCRIQADMSKIMAALNGIKGGACGVMVSKCSKACMTEAQFYTSLNNKTKANEARRQAGQCRQYNADVTVMLMASMQHGVGYVQNNECEKEMRALANQPMPTFSPITLPNPTDCSDPNNQSFACFCSREGNKSSPMCAGFNSGGGLAGGGATPRGPGNGIGSSVATPFTGTDTDGDGVVDDGVAMGQKQNASNGGDGYSPGGGGAPGGSIGALGGDDGGGGFAGDPKSAITGTSGGTGTGLGSSGGGGGGLARNNGGAGAGGGLMDKFNLKRFLPGSKYKARGIAGMSVKSVDGITGPMGPSIWEKATRQYQEQIQKQNVLIDRDR